MIKTSHLHVPSYYFVNPNLTNTLCQSTPNRCRLYCFLSLEQVDIQIRLSRTWHVNWGCLQNLLKTLTCRWVGRQLFIRSRVSPSITCFTTLCSDSGSLYSRRLKPEFNVEFLRVIGFVLYLQKRNHLATNQSYLGAWWMDDYIMYNANIMFSVKAWGGSFEVLSNRRYSSPTTSYSEMKCATSISVPSSVQERRTFRSE